MIDEDEEGGRYELNSPRPFSWFTVGLIAIDGTEDVLHAVSGSLGKIRCHMSNHLQWSESNEGLLREIQSLPEI